MGIEDRQGKRDVEQSTSRPSEQQKGGTTSGKSGDNAAVKGQQQETRDAVKRTLNK